MANPYKEFNTIHVIQGDQAVSKSSKDIMTTVLGSCVATCLYDPIAKVGGMNHFLLPGGSQGGSNVTSSFGLNAMELLINGLLKKGAKRENFSAKIFGGAKMFDGLSDIGMKNSKFAREFLSFEGIDCVSEDLGGTMARRLRFWPTTGRAQLKMMGEAKTVVPVKRTMAEAVQACSNDVELF